MSFNDAYKSLIDFDLKNESKKKSEKKEAMKKDAEIPKETKKRSQSKSPPRTKETRKRSYSKSPPRTKVESKKEEFIDYNIPNRQFGDLYCVLCDSHMNSEQMWEAHITGKRHIKAAAKGDIVETKYEYVDKEPTILKELEKETRPIAGLDHICEILHDGHPNTYQCFLCSANLATSKLLMEHIMGLKHRMAFLNAHDKEKYALVDSSALSKSYLEPIVQDLISKYENEHGRGKMTVKRVKGKSGPSSLGRKYDSKDNKYSSLNSKKSSVSRTSRYSPPPKASRYSPPPKPSRYSPPPSSSRYSPSYPSQYSPPPFSSQYSPPPKSTRMQGRNLETEWKKVSPVDERSRERRYSDRALYAEEDKWAKIDPESTAYRRDSAYLDVNSRLDQTNNYSRAWTPPDTGSDLRVVLEQKKNLGMISTPARANINVLPAAPVSSEITNVSDNLLQLVNDLSPEVFLSLTLFKLDNMLVKDSIELNLLDRVANKATALALDVKKKFPTSNLKAKYQETLAQNGITTQVNNVRETSLNNMEFTQNLENLIGHYKARKATSYDDVPSQDSYSSRLLASEQYIDSRSSQQNTSTQYRNSQENASNFDATWNQRSSTSVPFQSFSSTPTNIPGLTLTEEQPAQPSTSTAISQFAQTAKNIFGNINVPSAPSNPYQNEDYNRLNYRY